VKYPNSYSLKENLTSEAIQVLSHAIKEDKHTDEQIRNMASALIAILIKEATEDLIESDFKSAINKMILGQKKEYHTVY